MNKKVVFDESFFPGDRKLSPPRIRERVPVETGSLSQQLEKLRQAFHGSSKKVPSPSCGGQALGPGEVEAILNSAGSGILILDSQGRTIYHNAKLRQMFCADGQRVEIDQSRDDWLCSLEARATGCIFQTLMAQEAAEHQAEWSFAQRDFEVFGTRVGPPGGKTSRVVLVFEDITSKLEIDRMKNNFVSTAAHELLTPLTAILGYAELLSEQQLPESVQKEGLGIIQEKAEVLSRLVDDLLDTSRIEAGQRLELTLERIDLAEVLRCSVRSCQRPGASNPVRLVVSDGPLLLLADRRRMEQVIDNLLSNATKYSFAGAPIEINAGRVGEELQLTVTDQGRGMNSDQVARVFEIFYRADRSDTAPSGIGMGLGLARYLVEAHDGSLEIESKPGKGTRVCFKLPLAGPEGGGQLSLFSGD